MKNNYKGFRGWLNYIRDYKDNIDNDLISEQKLIDANKEIEKLKKKIETQEYIYQEQCELSAKLDARIQKLNGKYGGLKRNNNELMKSLVASNNDYMEAVDVIEEKKLIIKQLNMKYAGSQRKIKKLTNEIEELNQELAKKDHKINFLKSSKHAPSKEEIEAYEMQMKEVEKRIKNK